MNIIKWPSLVLIILLSTLICEAQSTFEGVIIYNTTNAAIKEKAKFTWYYKNGDSRFDIDSKAGDSNNSYSLVMKTDDSKAWAVSEQGSEEIPVILPDDKIVNAKFVRRTNTSEKGYDCQMLMFRSGDFELVYWMTEDIPIKYEQLPKLMKNNMPRLAGISNGFLVKMEIRDAGGAVIQSQDLVSFKEEKVDDTRFEIK